MNKIILTAVVALSMAGAAQAQSLGEKTGINALVGKAPTTQDFVTEASRSDMFEIQENQLAQAKGGEKEKTFAAKMIADHTRTTAEMKGMIVNTGEVKASPPLEMTSSQQSMVDKLKGLSGGDFNKQFWSDQVSAHKDAVSLFERYSQGDGNDSLKVWAGKTLPALREHLKMAEANNK